MKITERLNGKNVLIWGYGREGKATERFIQNFCSVNSLDVFEGKADEIDESKYDYIIKSPGIKVDEYHKKYTSQTELFLEQFAPQTIGITGTKGKSTTSSMLHSVLSACLDRKVLLVGNIGLPCLDYYEEIDEDTVIVFEMSCHQLSHQHYSPHIAVFLNLYQDHLDYYGTVEKYFEAKRNITEHQSEQDYVFFGNDVPPVVTKAQSQVLNYDEAMCFDMRLKGQHNQFNATFVYKIATELFGCSDEAVRGAIEVFHGLSHRLEFVGMVNGVEYYNDSISTIPEATIQAVNSVANAKTVMVGGMDRHINYDQLIAFMKEHSEYDYILSYESGKRIYEQVADLPYCYYKETLVDAVAFAKEITPAGKACLFSPAAASYGYFKNFEERGEVYKSIVLGE